MKRAAIQLPPSLVQYGLGIRFKGEKRVNASLYVGGGGVKMILECVGSHWMAAPEDKSNGHGHREAKPELPVSALPVAK